MVPKMSRPSLSLVLPGYNEEASIRETIELCLRGLGAHADRYEVVIVDDASTDGMPAIAEALSREHASVRVIHNPINLGAGTSLLIGFRAATGDVVLHNSMDYPFDLADLGLVLPLFPASDVVAVVRTDRSAHSPYRKLTSVGHHWLVRLLFRIRFRDMNFVQAYKREALQHLPVKARSPAFVTPELLIRARDRGFRIAEVEAPFHRRNKGKASYGKPRDILWTLSDMLSFWLERHAGRRARPAAGEGGR